MDWAAARAQMDPPGATVVVAGFPRKTIHTQIAAMGEGYDHILIDGPPRVDDVAASAAMAVDIVIIPVTPSPYDVWASEEIINILSSAGVYKPIKAAFLLNRRIAKSAIARDVYAALSDYPIPVLESTITQRVIFAESAMTGKAVFEIDPNGAATAEIEKLVNELEGMSK